IYPIYYLSGYLNGKISHNFIGRCFMFSLMRQQLYITSALSYISIALFIFIAFMVTMPSVYIFAVIVGVFILTVFYADHEHKSLRFTASLPVTKTMMVKSRYYFLGTVMCLV